MMPRRPVKYSTIVMKNEARFLVLLLASMLACSCTSPDARPDETGAALARQYCGTCHAYPEPDLLDVASWRTVLPFMAGRLGVYPTHSRDSLIAMTAGEGFDVSTLYPEAPALTEEEWRAIEAYYMDEAPAALDTSPREPPVTIGLPGFTVRQPAFKFRMPLTMLVDIQDEHRLFLLGNYAPGNSTVLVINRRGEVLYEWPVDSAPVAARWQDGRQLILLIGPGMEPTDAAVGSVQVVEGPEAPVRPLVTDLVRPVDMDLGDLNGDGRDDIVICEFGNHHGFLSWYEDAGDGSYRRHVLDDRPGAASVAVRDLDGDGLLDVAALTAQGDEGVDVYLNEGDGQFRQRRVLRFPPAYGSNHIELADFDGDGILDILYTNGDNADATPILKPYHGVRIFLGDADGSFEEQYFFPLHGAVSASAADFDRDGDLDIAAISYFPDYANAPEESFVLLENQGDLTFERYTFEDSYRGHWLTMDVGDLDGDGDPDVMLGSNIGFGPMGDRTGLYERWVEESPSIVILENETVSP